MFIIRGKGKKKKICQKGSIFSCKGLKRGVFDWRAHQILFSPQMHPLGLCNNNDEEDLYEYGWVGVVKLEQPELDPSCLTVLGKVHQHIRKHTIL